MSVLIADDAEDSREMYAEYLAFKGYAVDTATNGRDLLTKVALKIPDVLVLDLTMPGVTGLDVIRTLRAEPRTANLFVIVVTANALKGTEAEVIAAGGDMYLAKPSLPEALEAVIAAGRPRPRRRPS